MGRKGIRLYGVVHEEKGWREIREYLQAEIFLDDSKGFFGPEERWIGLGEFIKPVNWVSSYRAWRDGFSGNLEGEGRLLGGLYIISNERVELEWRASAIGDPIPLELIENTLKRLQ
eukprot:TRINITY_DN13310_c0_g1_i1.p2 TRINITY_DN13310_c0_g1~~TRINITY_DN13310_c0_g1_i1.p2  ORF type:complete len:116 (+),score=13.44 TRINITY_DN13310_c0_g1_i1:436-783(+)